MTSRAALQASLAERLGSADEARWMIEGVLETGSGGETGQAGELDERALRALEDMACRRAAGEPLQYVLGSWPFRTLELWVDARALIPRPETEQVVEVALAEARRQLSAPAAQAPPLPPGEPFLVADLGTGSGAIALSVAAELGAAGPTGPTGPAGPAVPGRPGAPGLHVVATDVDHRALELAEANRRRVATVHPWVAAQVELAAGSWFDALAPGLRGRLGLVVSNPPYVGAREWAGLEPQVRREPYGALVGRDGSDGTPGFAGVEEVLGGAYEWLAPQGAVVVEMATHHAAAARDLALRTGYGAVRIEPDLAGKPRAVVARR